MTIDEKDQWQLNAISNPVSFGYWRHVNGGTYIVYSNSVFEENGAMMVEYFSLLKHTRWSRKREVFCTRFHFWRIATIEELSTAAFGGPDEIRRVFGSGVGR